MSRQYPEIRIRYSWLLKSNASEVMFAQWGLEDRLVSDEEYERELPSIVVGGRPMKSRY